MSLKNKHMNRMISGLLAGCAFSCSVLANGTSKDGAGKVANGSKNNVTNVRLLIDGSQNSSSGKFAKVLGWTLALGGAGVATYFGIRNKQLEDQIQNMRKNGVFSFTADETLNYLMGLSSTEDQGHQKLTNIYSFVHRANAGGVFLCDADCDFAQSLSDGLYFRSICNWADCKGWNGSAVAKKFAELRLSMAVFLRSFEYEIDKNDGIVERAKAVVDLCCRKFKDFFHIDSTTTEEEKSGLCGAIQKYLDGVDDVDVRAKVYFLTLLLSYIGVIGDKLEAAERSELLTWCRALEDDIKKVGCVSYTDLIEKLCIQKFGEKTRLINQLGVIVKQSAASNGITCRL